MNNDDKGALIILAALLFSSWLVITAFRIVFETSHY